jgi:protein-S-isoprenylcysteine O-methyltransferase Ste14
LKDAAMSMPDVERAVPEEPSSEVDQPSPVQPESSPSAAGNITLLDLLERVIVLGFYAFFFWIWFSAYYQEPTWSRALFIVAEGLVVLLLLVHRPAHSISTSLGEWIVALVTTVLPLLLATQPHGTPIAPEWVGVTLMTAGFCGRIICTLYLGRSFGLVAANRGVKRAGPYRWVRHPMYTTYLIIHLGVLLSNPLIWNVLVLLVCWCLMLLRIMIEENHLSQDPAYVDYQKVVRYRLIPGVL